MARWVNTMQFFFITGVCVLYFVGCASHTLKTDPPVPRTIEFPQPIQVSKDFKVTDKSDPEELIKIALSESEKNRHDSAIDFLRRVSVLPAPNNELRISALFAVANEHLYTGDIPGFINVMNELDTNLDAFRRAGLTQEESALLTIYDLARDKPYNDGYHHAAFKRFFMNQEENK